MGSAAPRLRLVSDPSWNDAPAPAETQISFCSHCAAQPHGPTPGSRVCSSCGFGVLLEAPESAVPPIGGAFLVVDRAMSICALSRGAEELLEVSEVQAVHRHLTELLTPADAEAQNRGGLAFAVSAAVGGEAGARGFTMRPANLFGVRLRTRIVPCGPTPGALVLID